MYTQSASPTHTATPRPAWSVKDQMVAHMLDHVARDGGISFDDLELAGFTQADIADNAAEAARIARRRMTRQIEVA